MVTNYIYIYTFVILSLHDTILSPSCTVRCPEVTESLVFIYPVVVVVFCFFYPLLFVLVRVEIFNFLIFYLICCLGRD